MNEETIFAEAVAKRTPQEREAYLAAACQGNAELRAAVEELLSASNAAGSFFEHPPAGLDVTVDAAAHDTHKSANWDGSLAFLKPCDKRGRIGRLIGNAGEYEIIEVVGSGGMGVVLRAFDTKLSRVVAVKVLAPELAVNPTAVKRFLREAKAAAAVVHDHVVTIHNVEELHQPPFLVMQFIDGQTLQQKIDRQGSVELKEILRIGCQTAAGLAAAHKHGLVHRDVKPANILLENGVERVKITDFGLARAADDIEITQQGLIAGTPQYMSPEQARGEPLDARSDLFSLGSVLYTMCTGRPAFRAETTMGVLRRVCDDEPRPIHEVNAEIPMWLEGIVSKLLAKYPDERFQSAGEVSELLGQCLAHVQNPTSVQLPAAVELLHGTPAAQPAAQHSSEKPPAPTLLGALLHRSPLLIAIAVTCIVTLAASLILQNPIVSSIAMVVFMSGVGIATYAVTFVWIRSLARQADSIKPHTLPTKDAQRAPVPAWGGAGIAVLVVVLIGCALLMTVLVAAGISSAVAWYIHRSHRASPPLAPVAEVTGEATAPLGWTPLFNGQNLAGWKTHPDQSAAWTVKDNTLVGRGANNYLYTTRGDYGDFRLRAEVKINAQGDSGILVRMAPPSEPSVAESGYEVQLMGDPNHVSPAASIIRHGSSVGGQVAKGRGDLIRPGEWFALEISAIGGELTVSIDGRQVVSYRDKNSRASGHIALQSFSEQTEVQFRKAEIQELPVKAPDWVRLFNGQNLAGWEKKPDQPGGWVVEEGVLIGRGKPGSGRRSGESAPMLATLRGDFEDFHFRAEMMLSHKAAGSIFFRATMPPGEERKRQPDDPTGYQVQFAGGKLGCVAGLSTDYQEVKPGEWFTLEIRAEGKHLTIKVNGNPTADVEDGAHQRGHFVIWPLDPDGVVKFRKIEIRETPSPAGVMWGPIRDGWQAGFGWKNGKLKYAAGEKVEFALKVRNATNAEKTIRIVEPNDWDLWYSGESELSVRIFGRDEQDVKLGPREEKSIDVPKALIDLDGLAGGSYRVKVTTDIGDKQQQPADDNFGLEYVGPAEPPFATVPADPLLHPDTKYAGIAWGKPILGLSVGIRAAETNPQRERGDKTEDQTQLDGREFEFFFWNTDSKPADVEYIRPHPLDWQPKLRDKAGKEYHTEPILTGPKTTARAHLDPGQVISLGTTTLKGPWLSDRVPQGELQSGAYHVWSHFNCRRLGYAHLNLRITSGETQLEVKP